MENNSPVGGAITCILLNIYLNAAGVNRSVAVTREKKPLVHVTETPLWFCFFFFFFTFQEEYLNPLRAAPQAQRNLPSNLP